MNEALNRLSLLKRHNGTDAAELDAVYESIKNDQRFREFHVQYSILFLRFFWPFFFQLKEYAANF